MNKLLLDLEKLELNELTYIFEYLVELINQRKEEQKLKQKHLKVKENLTKNFRAKLISAQNADIRQ